MIYVNDMSLNYNVKNRKHFVCTSAKDDIFSPVSICLAVNRITKKILIKYL